MVTRAVAGNPQSALEWKAFRLQGQEPLAVRASKRMRSDDLLVTRFAGTSLRMELDKIPLWRGDHAEIKHSPTILPNMFIYHVLRMTLYSLMLFRTELVYSFGGKSHLLMQMALMRLQSVIGDYVVDNIWNSWVAASRDC